MSDVRGRRMGLRRVAPVPALRRSLAALAAFVSALVVVSSASAAAPNYIIVSGHALTRPVLLGDWSENLQVLVAIANAPRARGDASQGLRSRPSFDLAEFWNWSNLPRPTRPSQANQHGRFYPAHGGRPAVILLTVDGTTFPRLVPPSVLQIFRRHHVPLRL